MKLVHALTIAAAMTGPTVATGTVPVTAPPPSRVELSEQQREARAQSCRSDVQRLFGSGAGRPEYLDAASRRAAAQFRIRSVSDILGTTTLELRVYVVAMVQVDLAEHWIGSQPAYFQCQFDRDGVVVSVEAI